jgi:hypothetical protein
VQPVRRDRQAIACCWASIAGSTVAGAGRSWMRASSARAAGGAPPAPEALHDRAHLLHLDDKALLGEERGDLLAHLLDGLSRPFRGRNAIAVVYPRNHHDCSDKG